MAGYLSSAELEPSDEAVDHSIETSWPLLVAAHYPLVNVNCNCLDTQRVGNVEEALASLVGTCYPVVVILEASASGFNALEKGSEIVDEH